jgi:hypothetical protein
MPSLINIIQNINAPNYPIRHWLVFFCELTNGHGDTNTKVRIVDARREDRIIFEQTGKVRFTDVRQIVTLAVNLQGIMFPQAGEYRFQLLAEDNLLGERAILLRKVEPPQKTGGQSSGE